MGGRAFGGDQDCVPRPRVPMPTPQVCEQSCAALCVLALRKPENSRVIMEGGGALAALQAMKAHPREANVQVGVWVEAGGQRCVAGAGGWLQKALPVPVPCPSMACPTGPLPIS